MHYNHGGRYGKHLLRSQDKRNFLHYSWTIIFSLKDHALVITKALYGLLTSGLRWHERLADCLRDMGFQACNMEPDIWIQIVDNKWCMHYEYIAVYVCDLLIESKSPQLIVDALRNKQNFKLKGTGPISYHLGFDFTRDGNNEIDPRKYIDKMSDFYVSIFGSNPKSTY